MSRALLIGRLPYLCCVQDVNLTCVLSDCTAKNLMMDADPLYPLGFHPVKTFFLPDAVTPASPLPRHSAKVKYYYIDFGISSHFPPDRRGDRLVLGREGRDRDVPELSTVTPYDPFKVDVFIIGNLLRHEFHDVCILLRPQKTI